MSPSPVSTSYRWSVSHPTRKRPLLPLTPHLVVATTAPSSLRMGRLDRSCQKRTFWPWPQSLQILPQWSREVQGLPQRCSTPPLIQSCLRECGEGRSGRARAELAQKRRLARAKLAQKRRLARAELAQKHRLARAELAQKHRLARAELAQKHRLARAELAQKCRLARAKLAQKRELARAELAQKR